ncbi:MULTISPECIES: hypothetical protein [Chryseobacterium]|uniref:hypothetical protein n=1 Tax=Chryseobacterium TaxID=59732 RepID=UPI0012979268|nr:MULTISPECIES: hypothetical protein [Chryseobacterium]MDR6920528.1 hypothetical protein [Chryseobacterium sp. 2987]
MNQKKLFPAVESKISVLTTWLVNGLLYGLLLFCFVIFGALPVYGIYKRGWENTTVPIIICLLILCFIWAPSVWFYGMKRKKMANKIVIDDSGLFHYNAHNEVVTRILYTQLVSSGRDFDITTISTSKGLKSLLEFHVQDEKADHVVKQIEMSLPMHVVNNRYHLYAHFLKGISTFRPDLKIDPKVFRDYSIDKETWQVFDKSSTSLLLLMFLAVFLTAGLLIWLVMVFT